MLLSLLFTTLITSAFPLDGTGVANYAMVRGIVTVDDEAVRNVRVVAYSDVDVRETRTNARGEYYFMSLIPGAYYIRAYNPHPLFLKGVTRWCADNDPIELSAGLLYLANVHLSAYYCKYTPVPGKRFNARSR